MASMTLSTLTIVNGNLFNVTAWTLTCPAGTDPILSTAERNAAADAVADLADTSGNPYIEIHTSGDVLLGTIVFQNPCFGAASVGVCTAAGLPKSGFAVADGTAAKWKLFTGSAVARRTGTCGT